MRHAAFISGVAGLVIIAALAGCAAKPPITKATPPEVATKPHAEVLLLGPQPGDYQHPWQQLTDVLVEYGVYIESDENDNLPTSLPANLKAYKVVVVDKHWAGLKDPDVQAKLRDYANSSGVVVYQDPPIDLTSQNDNDLYLFWGDEGGSRTKLAGDLSQYKVILADGNLDCLRDPAT